MEDKATGFYLGGAEDLLPNRLVLSNSRSPRMFDYVPLFLESANVLYRQLALKLPEYGPAYTEVANYVEAGAEGRTISESGIAPDDWMRRQLKVDGADKERRWVYREETVPRQVSDVLAETALLPLYVRAARCLDADGTTRTELFWSLPAEALHPAGRPPDTRYLVQTTAVQRSRDYTPSPEKAPAPPTADGRAWWKFWK